MFCLVAIASFVLFTNAATADNKSEKEKVVKAPVSAPVEVTADVDKAEVVKTGHNCRRFHKLQLPRFEFPEIKLPKLNCSRLQAEESEVAEEATDCGGKVLFERNLSRAGHVKNVKYVKFPKRFLPKRIVKIDKNDDVKP
ncbi:MAG: hypothetical protein LBC74_02985 [Planctomycetaceae bacterium]|nr:hypothetical protein [Planctomycetaceae bacterium]